MANRGVTNIVPANNVLLPQDSLTENWNLVQMIGAFSDTRDVLNWLAEWRLIKNYMLFVCGGVMYLHKRVKSQEGFMWKCHCKKYNSTRNGSLFEKSRLTLNKIVLLIYDWARELSQDTAIHESNISNKTAIDWYNFCRNVCHDGVFNRSEKIGVQVSLWKSMKVLLAKENMNVVV